MKVIDFIRGLNAEELAAWLSTCGDCGACNSNIIGWYGRKCDSNCDKCIKQWLESDVEGKVDNIKEAIILNKRKKL